MGLGIWFEEDIRNALLAANKASAAATRVIAETESGGRPETPAVLRAYREGYKAALVTVALAFGITLHLGVE